MRKRFTIDGVVVGALAGILLLGTPAKAQLTLNGRQINYTMAPFAIGDFLMVPLDETLAFLGNQTLQWDPETLTARFTFQGDEVAIRLGSGYAIVNNQAVLMGVPAVARNDRLLVPLGFLREQFGISVTVPPGFVAQGVRSQVLGLRQPAVELRQPGEVGIGGVQLLVLETPAGFTSVSERAERTYTHLNFALESAIEAGNVPPRVSIALFEGMPTLFVAGLPVLTVTDEDAARFNMTPLQLARVWAGRLQRGLNQVFSS